MKVDGRTTDRNIVSQSAENNDLPPHGGHHVGPDGTCDYCKIDWYAYRDSPQPCPCSRRVVGDALRRAEERRTSIIALAKQGLKRVEIAKILDLEDRMVSKVACAAGV